VPVRTNATADGANLSAAARRLHDVVVIGGGPAGAAVARLLALRGRDVVLLEATAFDGPRFGETIAPEANPLLRELGVWDEFVNSGALESPGTVSAWGSPIPAETDFLRNVHGSGRHVDRNAFDAMLFRAAATAGVDVRISTRAMRCTHANRVAGDVDGNADGEPVWRVTTNDGRSDREVDARFVIDASGRNGIRLGADDRRLVDDALIAIFVRLAHAGAAPSDLRTLVEAVPDGWWYCAPLPSGESVAVFLTDPELYANTGIVLGEQLEHAPLTRARIGAAGIAASHVVHVPSSVRVHPAGDDYAAAGDAAATYDPLSGYGITKALDDARILAPAVDSALNGESSPLAAYADRVHRAFDAYTIQRRDYYASEHRWRDRSFWRNRTGAGSAER
jgi:flavin-dependent dehydrogenase